MKAAIPTSDAVYGELLRQIKSCAQSAQLGAASVINNVLVALYWELGRPITEQQREMNQE